MKKQRNANFKKRAHVETAILLRNAILAGIVLQAAVVTFSIRGSVFPGAAAMVSILTTCAQIIAGLYGTTLAGYTFFLSRIDALAADDPTLDYVAESLKERFKRLIWFITVTVLGALIATFTLLYWPQASQEAGGYVYRLFCNEFLISMGFSIALILLYAISVVDPNVVRKVAEMLKNQLSPEDGAAGSVPEFLSLYARVEDRCRALLDGGVLKALGASRNRRFAYDIQLLMLSRPDLAPLEERLTRLHRYYACTVNSRTLSVTEEMCTEARELLEALEKA